MSDVPTTKPDSTNLIDDAFALLPLALLAVVLFGSLHLISDLIVWPDTVFGALSGVLTDLKTTIAGASVLAGMIAAVGRPVPDRIGRLPGLGWVPALQADPITWMQRIIQWAVIVTGLQFISTVVIHLDAEVWYLLMLILHDLLFAVVVFAALLGLTAAAARRVGSESWSMAAPAQRLLDGAVAPAAAVGALLVLVTVVGQGGADGLAAGAFALLESAAGIAVIVVCGGIVREVFGSPAPETTSAITQFFGSPGRAFPLLIRVGLGAAGLYVLAAAFDGFGSTFGRGIREVANASLDSVAILAVLYVLRVAAAEYGTWNAAATVPTGSEEESAIRPTIRTGILLVVVVGVVGAIASLVVIGGGEGVYYLFNRLLRTSVAVGVLAGLQALHLRRIQQPQT